MRNHVNSTGRRSRQRGVTLLELLIVCAIVAVIVSMVLPSFTRGISDFRLSQASDSAAAFINTALSRVERRQMVMELTVSPRENLIAIRSADGAYAKKLDLPDGVRLEAALPRLPQDSGAARRFLLLPGGAPPRLGLQLLNDRGQRRIVRLDPITGVPSVEAPAKQL